MTRFVPLVEVIRSGFVECVHYGAFVVLAPDGSVIDSAGDVTGPIYPRSSNKPLQSVGLLRAGYFPSTSAHLALATASHCSEPEHIATIRDMLAEAELEENYLLCPPDLPWNERARAEVLLGDNAARKIFMNCSGKHAAMLTVCLTNKWPIDNYLDPDHPLQKLLAETIVELAGEPEHPRGVDGCGLPIIPLSLTGLARAFARLTTASPETHERRVADAVRQHPTLVSGTAMPDAVSMQTVPGLLCKSGADGVFAGALPDGSAVAFKIADGHDRPRLPLVAELLSKIGATGLENLPASPILGGSHKVGEVRAIPTTPMR
ncbi:asparaginase [Hoyosella rhizosphaerae]|uniref:Asparaginase n=1 Tax=Hoyosella rhizosphaerae TaxID=1755582 RepID=A0A916UI81_9ACTN|nr:asparaginase [Hoyosella rhizosphaerae]MBN4928253.1 asparaginase [Hoyosella rhizosphaerae]GGC73574.1 asparaginase [Hoyosella rhizosphaerae]